MYNQESHQNRPENIKYLIQLPINQELWRLHPNIIKDPLKDKIIIRIIQDREKATKYIEKMTCKEYNNHMKIIL